jgi:hypothetical protein
MQVSVTRNWFSHGSGRVAVAECTRVIQSVKKMICLIGEWSASDSHVVLDCIGYRISSIESVISDLSTDSEVLSIESHAFIIFVRALGQLRTAACQRFNLEQDVEIVKVVDTILKTGTMTSRDSFFCELIKKGRHYIFHGTDTHRTFSLLLCTCAVASLLRCVSSSDASPISLSPKLSVGKVARTSSPFICAPANLCEARVMQLLLRMEVFDIKLLVHDIVAKHSDM